MAISSASEPRVRSPGDSVAARLVVAADGAGSAVRDRLGIAVIPISTAQDVHRDLMEGLARRMRSRARL